MKWTCLDCHRSTCFSRPGICLPLDANISHCLPRTCNSNSVRNNWSLLSLCFTLSVESTLFISSSTSFWYQFLYFRLTYSFTRHFFLFWFTTLLIYNSLSSTPGLKPSSTCFTNPAPVVAPLPPGLLSRTIARTVSSELLGFCFWFSLFLLLCRALD